MAPETQGPDVHDGFVWLIETLGTRTAELHQALSLRTGDPAFDPEHFDASDLEAWKRRVHEDLRCHARSTRRTATQPSSLQPSLQELLNARDRLLSRIDAVTLPPVDLLKLPYTWRFHLGQVLVVNNDFMIIDFEGGPGRELGERRVKHLALRDVSRHAAIVRLRTLDGAASCCRAR